MANSYKAFEKMQLNNQVILIEQARQKKISESLLLKQEIQALEDQKGSVGNITQKKQKAFERLHQIQKEISDLTQAKNNVLRKITN